MSTSAVRRRLARAHGRTLVINCFEDRWPQAADVGTRTVAEVRGDDRLVENVMTMTGMSQAGVRRRLNAAHGATLIANLFANRWQED